MRPTLGAVTNVLFAAACLVVIVVGGLQIRDRLTGRGSSRSATPASVEAVTDIKLDLSSVTVKARGTPSVVLLEFSDFQCPYCGQYARATYGEIQKNFVDTGLIAYAFLNFPIERIHPLALGASEAAECAGRQERFWQMHDSLFANPSALTHPDLLNHGKGLDLNMTEFESCMSSNSMTSRVKAQMEEAAKARVVSTPTFFVGRFEGPQRVRLTTRILGAAPYTTFSGILKDAVRSR